MMNTPGVSLFQGADTLKVNSTLERQEEEEALQDQQRREAELGNLLENAFDDLDVDDEEETTVDSTTNFSSNILPNVQQQHYQQHQQLKNEQQDNLTANEMHRLKMLLESRMQELNNVNKMAQEAHKKADEYQKRMTIAEAELDRALREKQHTHELLVDSKEKCSHLDNNIEKLRAEKKSLETENTQLVGKLETAQTLLSDVQRKYDMVERDYHRRDDRNAELRIKQLEEHHNAQTELWQQRINQLTDQLDKKKQELDQMHMRYNALQSSHESMLLDKADKINELNSALDVAQRRYNQLASRPDFEAEYSRQQKCIADLHSQVASMEETIAQLTERVNGTTAELDVMDTLIQQHQSELDSPGRLPSRLLGSTPLNHADRIGHIKQELYKALGNLKTKREEVRKLEKQLDDRSQELSTLRQEENKILVQLATFKEEKLRLESRLKTLQEQLEEREFNSSQNTSKMQTEIDTLQTERDELQQQVKTQTSEQDKLTRQLQQAEMRLVELQLEHDNLQSKQDQLEDENRELRTRATADEIRLDLERHKILLKDSQSEVERVKQLYTDISNEKETLAYQLRKLNESDSIKELQEHRQQLAQQQHNLQLAELKAKELAKILCNEKLRHEEELQAMREKCERQRQEELSKDGSNNCSKCIEYLSEITKIEIQMLKLQNVKSTQQKELDDLKVELEEAKALQLELKAQAANQQVTLQEAESGAAKGGGDATEPSQVSSEFSQDRIRCIEKRVREEMSKLMAIDMKRFTALVQQSEARSVCLQREYNLVARDLQQRQTEVDLLKQTILAEREQMQKMLEEKDDKHKHILQLCRNELQEKHDRITHLMHEMEEQHVSIESERRSMKMVMAEWDKQKQSIDEVEKHWRSQLQSMRETHEEALRSAHQRYQSAKRTAQNYKLYAEDKDAHMKREYDRIKEEYHNSLTKIEATMQQHLSRKSRSKNRHANANDRDKDKENEPSNR